MAPRKKQHKKDSRKGMESDPRGRTKKKKRKHSHSRRKHKKHKTRRAKKDRKKYIKTDMFHVKTEEEEHEYELSEELSEYANNYMSKYVNDKGLKEKIRTENPFPTNIDKVKVMDEFLKGIMKDKMKSNEIILDSILEKVQKKTRDIFGPLARMWDYLENVVKKPSDEGESVSVNLEGLLSYTQQTVLVLGQALNTVSYHRKYNALSVLMSPNEAKTTIREEGDLLGKKDTLLGNEFR